MHAQQKQLSFLGLGSHTAAPLLYTYLKEHPQVCSTKEATHFFSNAKQFACGVRWYESNFPNCPVGSIRGELAHDYLASPLAAGLIAQTYSNAKLVAVIENPLVSLRVDYVEARRTGKVSGNVSLAQFLKQNPEVLLRARYGRQLINYFSYYSANDLLVLLAADIREDPLTSVRTTYEHLGLDATFVPLLLRHLIKDEEEEPKHRPGIIKRSFKALRKAVKNVLRKIGQRIKPLVVPMETASAVARKIPLSPELETYLKDYYREDARQLSSLLHRNVNIEWGIDEA